VVVETAPTIPSNKVKEDALAGSTIRERKKHPALPAIHNYKKV